MSAKSFVYQFRLYIFMRIWFRLIIKLFQMSQSSDNPLDKLQQKIK